MNTKYFNNPEYQKLLSKSAGFVNLDPDNFENLVNTLKIYKPKFGNIEELNDQLTDLFSKYGEKYESVISYIYAVEANVEKYFLNLVDQSNVEPKVSYYRDALKMFSVRKKHDNDKLFMSVDVTSASWNAIRSLLSINEKTFGDYLVANKSKFPDIFLNEGKALDYFLTSKKFRSASLAKILPKYQEAYLVITLENAVNRLKQVFKNDNLMYYYTSLDEVVVKLDDTSETLTEDINLYNQVIDGKIPVKTTLFRYRYLDNVNGSTSLVPSRLIIESNDSIHYKFMKYDGKNILKLIQKYYLENVE